MKYQIDDRGDELRIYVDGIEQDLAILPFDQGDYTDLSREAVRANAALFCAAPDLLEALKEIKKYNYSELSPISQGLLDDAISKAETIR